MQILCVTLVIGGTVGMVMPGGPLGGPAKEPAAAQDAGKERLAMTKASVPGWNEDLVLPRQPDGHFYAEAVIEGQSYPMLVDTGASMVALTGDDALAMGLDWEPGALSVVAQGASGPVEGVEARIPRMRVGDHEAEDVFAVIIPDGLGISLLGQSFLQTVGRVEISDDEMVLGAEY